MVSLIVAAIVALGAAICIAVKTPGDIYSCNHCGKRMDKKSGGSFCVWECS